MIPSPLNLLARLLHRHGFQLRGAKKRALVSYVATLPFYNRGYFLRAHNASLKAYLLCRALNSLGYSVDLRPYDDLDVPTDRTYDFFMGHTRTFLEIKNKIRLNGKAALLVTGSAPEFGNAAQHARAEDLYQRRGILLPVHSCNIVAPARELHAAADHILMLGNDFVRSTWYPEFQHKYRLINNASAQQVDLGPDRPVGFLFFSSTGQVHRGLDVLLDVFAERGEHLHICSAVLQEPDFVNAYRRELFERDNIHTHGFVNTSSAKFRRILAQCRFVILPSCSEGQSSSVINAMFNGLLPIVTRNAGLPDVDRCGYCLDEISTSAVRRVLDEVASMPVDDYRRRREELAGYLQLFTPPQLLSAIEDFLRNEVRL